jgi:hypothetical protein
MEFSNQKRSKIIKRTFNITGIVIVIVGLVFLWMKKDIPFMITVGVFAVFVGISQFANLCYVYFSTENARVLIRYYPVISILKKDYESIEFKHQSLASFQIEKSMGFADLEIAIKTKRGIAEYPTISLAALSKAEIEQIREALAEILEINRKGI